MRRLPGCGIAHRVGDIHCCSTRFDHGLNYLLEKEISVRVASMGENSTSSTYERASVTISTERFSASSREMRY